MGSPTRALRAAAAEFAARQHGVVSRRQLLAAGADKRSITRALAGGQLHRVHRGVYAVGHPVLPRHARYMAAVLACERSVLSHRAAAAMHDLLPAPTGSIDVTVQRAGGRPRTAIKVHVTRTLPDIDVVRVEAIPCTSPSRTVVDLAAFEAPHTMRRALEQLLVTGKYDNHAIHAALGRAPSNRGTGAVRAWIAELSDEPAPTRSELERLLLDLVRVAHLELPVVNGYVVGLQVDFHWPRYRVVVEVDGRRYHGHTIAIDRDRDRDLRLLLAGWRVARLTWRQVVNEPERVVRVLRSLLD